MKSIIAYSDGSCNVKTRLGGSGLYVQYRDNNVTTKEIEWKNGFSDTTISRMELRAIIKALQTIDFSFAKYVLIVSDSEYTINSINKGWILRWEQEGFDGRKNADLWKLFLSIWREKLKSNVLIFVHTRGHGKGIKCYQKGNDKADKLADYKQFKIYTKDEETIF